MSVDLVSLVLRQRISNPTEKMVLIVFAEHTNEDGLAYPSVDLVAAEVECSSRTVQRVIHRLLERGLLTQYSAAAGRGKPVTYRVCPEAIGRVPEYWELRQAQREASQPAPDKDSRQGDLLPQESVDNCVKGDTAMSPFTDLSTDLKGDNSSLKGDKNALMGDIAVSPEPRTINHRERSGDRELSTGTPSGSPDVTLATSSRTAHSSRSPPKSSRSSQRKRGQSHTGPNRRYQSIPGEIEKPSLQDVQKTAHYNALPPMGNSEAEPAFRSRINAAVSQLTVLSNQCRALKIKGRQEGESLKNFDRRVSEACLHAQGHTDFLSPEDARSQCRKAAGLRT